MGKRYTELNRIILACIVMVTVSSCAKRTIPIQPGVDLGSGISETTQTLRTDTGLDDPKWRELGIFSESELREFQERAQTFENEDVYFPYDSFLLDEEGKKVLERKVDFARRYPKVRVTIEGHCDERGTNEYNLALGERRANSAWQYMVNSGIDPDSISMISYGEERPVAFGSDDASMALNRRAHFVLYY